jgi:hypothetical protein
MRLASLQRLQAAVHLICLDTSLEIGIMRPVSPTFTRVTVIKKGLRIDGDSCDSLESFSLYRAIPDDIRADPVLPACRSKKSSRPSLAEPPRIIPTRPVDAEVKKDK